MDPAHEVGLLVFITAVFLAAGVVKGVSGMGLPTLAMALLGLVMPPAAAAALMVWPSLATNVAQCIGPHWRSLVRRLWPMWLALAAVSWLSPLPNLASAGASARVALGLVLIGYGLWGWLKPGIPDLRQQTVWAGAVAGALSGMLTVATGVFVMPLVPFLQSLKLDKDELVQALGLSFAVATLSLALSLPRSGLALPAGGLTVVALALAAAGLGLGIGAMARRRLQAAVFQRALHAVFIVLGAVLVLRALGAA